MTVELDCHKKMCKLVSNSNAFPWQILLQVHSLLTLEVSKTSHWKLEQYALLTPDFTSSEERKIYKRKNGRFKKNKNSSDIHEKWEFYTLHSTQCWILQLKKLYHEILIPKVKELWIFVGLSLFGYKKWMIPQNVNDKPSLTRRQWYSEKFLFYF